MRLREKDTSSSSFTYCTQICYANFNTLREKKKISQDNTHALAPASDLYAESLQSKSQ